VIALLSYLVHVHSHLRPSRQGLVHVGPITWEGCHRLEIELLPPYEYRRGWSSQGDLFESLGGLLGAVVFDPVLLNHLPCLDHCHLPLDHCPLEVAHPLDLHFYYLELDPYLGLVEMLAWKMMVDLELEWALRIP
jgi:hypothetical protein